MGLYICLVQVTVASPTTKASKPFSDWGWLLMSLLWTTLPVTYANCIDVWSIFLWPVLVSIFLCNWGYALHAQDNLFDWLRDMPLAIDHAGNLKHPPLTFYTSWKFGSLTVNAPVPWGWLSNILITSGSNLDTNKQRANKKDTKTPIMWARQSLSAEFLW